MKNKKGFIHHMAIFISGAASTSSALLAPKIAFGLIAAACMWHIPAWDLAKANHTEAAYQSQEMFPQQLFDKLPGGTPGRKLGQPAPVQTASVGGYWEGLVLAGK